MTEPGSGVPQDFASVDSRDVLEDVVVKDQMAPFGRDVEPVVYHRLVNPTPD